MNADARACARVVGDQDIAFGARLTAASALSHDQSDQISLSSSSPHLHLLGYICALCQSIVALNIFMQIQRVSERLRKGTAQSAGFSEGCSNVQILQNISQKKGFSLMKDEFVTFNLFYCLKVWI